MLAGCDRTRRQSKFSTGGFVEVILNSALSACDRSQQEQRPFPLEMQELEAIRRRSGVAGAGLRELSSRQFFCPLPPPNRAKRSSGSLGNMSGFVLFLIL
ncbi:MAG: hypothetical protein V7K76_14430 [Nostoc sp.]|uniref:hypothetical protein n=1 Tax=Nostoc sp. TaxID=1180 RepID=UPI002FF44B89